MVYNYLVMKRQINKNVLFILKKEEKRIYYRTLYLGMFIATFLSCILSLFYLLIAKYYLSQFFIIFPVILGVVSLIFLALFFFKKINISKLEKIIKLSTDNFENIEKFKNKLIVEKIVNDAEFLNIEQKINSNSKWKESSLFRVAIFFSRWFLSFATAISSSNTLQFSDIDKKWNDLVIPNEEETERLKTDFNFSKTANLLKKNILWYWYKKSVLFSDIKLGVFLGFSIFGVITSVLSFFSLILAYKQDSLLTYLLPLVSAFGATFVLQLIFTILWSGSITKNRYNFLMTLEFDNDNAELFLASLVKNSIAKEKNLRKIYDEANSIKI